MAATEELIAEITIQGLRRATTTTGRDRKTIRMIFNGKEVKASSLPKVIMGLPKEWSEKCQYEGPSEIPSGDCFAR